MSTPVHNVSMMLAPSNVHVWRIAVDGADAPGIADALSEDERRRAASYRFGQHRREFATTRAILRHLLAAYNGHAPERLRFRYSGYGKPELDGGGPHFNVAHAGGMALIAIARLQVGVDLERVDAGFACGDIATHFLSDLERDWIEAQPQARRTEAFFRCWTRREAYGKASGLGLASEAAWNVNVADERLSLIRGVEPFKGFVGAIAITCEVNFEVSFYDWQNKLPASCGKASGT